MKYLLILFLLICSTSAKDIEIKINKDLSYTYIDNNEDGIFDSLLTVNGKDITVHILNQFESRPNKTEYNIGILELGILNYSDSFKDAYFHIRLKVRGKFIGYYEHNFKKKELTYRSYEWKK